MEKVRERLDVRCEIDIRLGKFDSSEQRTSLVTVDIPLKQRKFLASAGKLKDFTLDSGAVFVSPDYTPDELQRANYSQEAHRVCKTSRYRLPLT